MNLLPALTLVTLLPFQRGTGPQDTQRAPINGPAIIFFEPPKAEGDSLVQLSGVELADVFDDFDLSAGKAAVYAKRLGVPVHFVTDPVIFVNLSNAKVRTFERRSIFEHIGMILTDGHQEPRLVPGVTDERRLLVEINEFFQIK